MNEQYWRGKYKLKIILDTLLKEEFIEMTFDLEAKTMYIFKVIGYWWMNEKTVTKYLKFCATVEPSLLAFPLFVFARIWV